LHHRVWDKASEVYWDSKSAIQISEAQPQSQPRIMARSCNLYFISIINL